MMKAVQLSTWRPGAATRSVASAVSTASQAVHAAESILPAPHRLPPCRSFEAAAARRRAHDRLRQEPLEELAVHSQPPLPCRLRRLLERGVRLKCTPVDARASLVDAETSVKENSLNHWVAQAVAFLRAEDAPRGRLFVDLFALCGDFEGLLLVREETLTWWSADVSNAWLDAVFATSIGSAYARLSVLSSSSTHDPEDRREEDGAVDERCGRVEEVAILDHSTRARGGGRDYVVEDRHFNARTVHLLLQRLPRNDAVRLFDRLTQESSGDGNRGTTTSEVREENYFFSAAIDITPSVEHRPSETGSRTSGTPTRLCFPRMRTGAYALSRPVPLVPSSSLHSHFVRDTTSPTAPEERELLFAWNVVLKRCVADLPWKAMDLLCGIVFKNPERLISPDSYTFTAAFDLCARHGRSLFHHHDVASMKSGVNVVVSTQEQLARALLVEAARVPDAGPLPLQERKVVNACVGAFQCWETALLFYQELFRHEGLRVADRCRAGETFFGKAGSSSCRFARSGSLYERFLAWKKRLGRSSRGPIKGGLGTSRRKGKDNYEQAGFAAQLSLRSNKRDATINLDLVVQDGGDKATSTDAPMPPFVDDDAPRAPFQDPQLQLARPEDREAQLFEVLRSASLSTTAAARAPSSRSREPTGDSDSLAPASDELRDPRPAPDAVSHTAVLTTLARNGRKNEAVRVLECIAPDAMDPRVRAAGLRCFDPEEIVALLRYLLHRSDPASSSKKEDQQEERRSYDDYDSLPPTLQKLTRIFDRAFAVSKAEHRQGRRYLKEMLQVGLSACVATGDGNSAVQFFLALHSKQDEERERKSGVKVNGKKSLVGEVQGHQAAEHQQAGVNFDLALRALLEAGDVDKAVTLYRHPANERHRTVVIDRHKQVTSEARDTTTGGDNAGKDESEAVDIAPLRMQVYLSVGPGAASKWRICAAVLSAVRERPLSERNAPCAIDIKLRQASVETEVVPTTTMTSSFRYLERRTKERRVSPLADAFTSSRWRSGATNANANSSDVYPSASTPPPVVKGIVDLLKRFLESERIAVI